MAGKAKITVVVVPWSVAVETGRIGRVDPWIGPAHTIDVTMASGAGTGGIIDVVAGSAVFDIGSRRATVVDSPVHGRVSQRHPVLALVTIVAE